MDIRGKKHICPFCNAMFYDMNKEVINCPKCKQSLSKEDEMEFIRKKKKAESKITEEETKIIDNIDMDEMDLSESEMFFDMEDDDTISHKHNYMNDDEY